MKCTGTTIQLADPRVVSKADAAAKLAGFGRAIFPRLPFDSAVLLKRVN
jgi:hypothetical protein